MGLWKQGLEAAYYVLVASALVKIIYVQYLCEETSLAPRHHNHDVIKNPLDPSKRPQQPTYPNQQSMKQSKQPQHPNKHPQATENTHPLVFVGGHPRSGTTLLRAMLDAHGDVRCGEETHIVPKVASLWDFSKGTSRDLVHLMSQGGLIQEVMDRAVAKFLLRVIRRDSSKAVRLCNKDPFVMMNAVYLHRLFPNSKFIFVIRDGRAAIHSAVSRSVTIMDYNLASYEESLRMWNWATYIMQQECEELGPHSCLPVYYEHLILQPRRVMRSVLRFLDLPWREHVLHHHKFVDKTSGGISLSSSEKSTSQVRRARYTDALTSWVGRLPFHLLQDMDVVAPMLAALGYDAHANPPPYHRLVYTWGSQLLNGSAARHPVRTFLSALHHRTNEHSIGI